MENEKISVVLHNMGTVNTNRVSILCGNSRITLYFSYQTLVGVDGFCSQNEWSKTTGKLLNQICPDKKERIPHERLMQIFQERMKKVFFAEPELLAQEIARGIA